MSDPIPFTPQAIPGVSQILDPKAVAGDFLRGQFQPPAQSAPQAQQLPAQPVAQPAPVQPQAQPQPFPASPAAQPPVAPAEGQAPAGPDPDALLAGRFGRKPAEKPAEPKPGETHADDDLKLPDNATDQQKHVFAKLRSERAEALKRAADFEARMKELEKKQAEGDPAKLAAELAERDKRLAEQEELIGRLDLAETPAFKQRHDLKLAEVKSKLARALDTYTALDKSKIEQTAADMLSATPQELREMTKTLDDPTVAGLLLSVAEEGRTVREARERELADWRTTRQGLGIEESRRSVVESAAQRQAMADAAVQAAKLAGNLVFTEPSLGELSAKVEQEFKAFAQTASAEQMAQAAAEGFAAPLLQDMLTRAMAKIEALQAEVDQRSQFGRPPVFPVRPPDPAPPKPTLPGIPPVNGALPPGVQQRDPAGSVLDIQRAAAQAAIMGMRGR